MKKTYSRAKMIRVYDENNGALTTNMREAEDFGGLIGVTGEIIPLTGWPTPAMRRAIDSAGEPTAWYVGTNLEGNIL